MKTSLFIFSHLISIYKQKQQETFSYFFFFFKVQPYQRSKICQNSPVFLKVTYLNSWFKLPTLETNSQQFTYQTREHTPKVCEAFETLLTIREPKSFGQEGTISQRCAPSLCCNGQLHFTPLALTALEPGPSTLSKMNFACWNTQLWAGQAQEKAAQELHVCVLRYAEASVCWSFITTNRTPRWQGDSWLPVSAGT